MAHSESSGSKLFDPLQIGKIHLKHRVVMAPLTRYRGDDKHVPLPIVTEYYAQRASVPGTLLISEGTFISRRGGGYPNIPGIWNEEQCAAWKQVTDAVHAKGSFIYLQLWCLGRAALLKYMTTRDGLDIVSSGDIPIDNLKSARPRPMSEEEIWGFIDDYAQAASNAVKKAGFDGVEIHGANGYMIDQFTQDTCNNRTDGWGGSMKNRARFGIEVAKAVVKAVGAERVGMRLSPFSRFQAMRMQEPIPQFSYLVRELKQLRLAYLHLIEARIAGNADSDQDGLLTPLINIWANQSPLLLAGGYTAASAKQTVDEQHPDKDVAIVFGRNYISNPDLPYKIKAGIDFVRYDRSTFYKRKSPDGYTDYPFSSEFLAQQAHL